MYNLFLIYDLDITPVDRNNGVIKAKLNLEHYKQFALRNQDVYRHFRDVLRMYCPEFTEQEHTFIDIFYLDIMIDGYKVKTRFIEITNTMLLTSTFTNDTIKTGMHRHMNFMHDITTKGDICFNYRLEKMIEKMEEKKFYNLNPISIPIKTKIFNYQLNNINWMIEREEKPLQYRITDDKLIHFPDERIYNYSKSSFVSIDSIPLITFKGGIIADEVGKGKTIQALSLCFARNMPTLILVPSHLKNHWESELIKHFDGTPDIEIVTFNEFKIQNFKGKKRIIVDELHMLYSDDRFNVKYDEVRNSRIEYKWGITATPFAGKCSLQKITQFLTEKEFLMENFERYLYYDEVFVNLFRRNITKNIQDEIMLPPLRFENHLLSFNTLEKSIYLSELQARENASEYDLRQFCCDTSIKFENETGKVITESDFKKSVLYHFENILATETEKANSLSEKLETINQKLLEFPSEDLKQNKAHYEHLLKDQQKIVRNRESSVTFIKNQLADKKECGICKELVQESYIMTKNCHHIFCNSDECCATAWLKKNHSCPNCRTVGSEFWIFGQIKEDNKYSTKLSKLLEIIHQSPTQIIVFTQFEKMIKKIMQVLHMEDIPALEFSENNIQTFKEGKAQVLVLSSKDNACGLDLSFVSQIVIFEPIKGDFNFMRDIELQIIGRIYRINQTRECVTHRLIIEDTIEEQLYKHLL